MTISCTYQFIWIHFTLLREYDAQYCDMTQFRTNFRNIDILKIIINNGDNNNNSNASN